MSYAYLVYAGDVADPENGRFLQAMQEKATAISSHLLFFTLELNKIEEGQLDRLLTVPALAHWQPWIRDVRIMRDHQLSDEAGAAPAREAGGRPRRLGPVVSTRRWRRCAFPSRAGR